MAALSFGTHRHSIRMTLLRWGLLAPGCAQHSGCRRSLWPVSTYMDLSPQNRRYSCVCWVSSSPSLAPKNTMMLESSHLSSTSYIKKKVVFLKTGLVTKMKQIFLFCPLLFRRLKRSHLILSEVFLSSKSFFF